MADPITTEDLYGKSSEPKQEPPPITPAPIQYEETPEIHPVAPAASTEGHDTHPPAPKKAGSVLGTILTGVIFLGLFAGGIWISSVIRQFLPASQQETSRLPTPTPLPGALNSVPNATNSADVNMQWKTYDVISGVTKLSFAGITFKLPTNVLSPICDGTGCASQGTYLPGGTRFTVAPRGSGEALADFRGSIISDVNGISFTTKKVTVGGRPATEFTGSFTGRTLAGYAFSKMRGVMIEITPNTSLEINHFTPNGVTADFVSDDTLFDSILTTVSIPAALTPTTLTPTSTIPVATSTPRPATGSGY